MPGAPISVVVRCRLGSLRRGRRGNALRVAADVEIDRALATLSATLNDQQLPEFDAGRVQQIVTESLGGEPALTVDDGGGLHDETGARVGAVRRSDSGEWITERQNSAALFGK